MVDKLDLRIDTLTPMRPAFAAFLGDVREHPGEFKFHQTEHYAATGSLEPFGVHAIFHGWLRHKNSKGQSHKLELLDVGEDSLAAAEDAISQIVDVDPLSLEVMRADCAVDTSLPVDFYYRNMRVQFKRKGARLTEFMHIHKGAGETIYWGARPNCVRTYNKKAEMETRYNRAMVKLRREIQTAAVQQYATAAERESFAARWAELYGDGAEAERIAGPDRLEIEAKIEKEVRKLRAEIARASVERYKLAAAAEGNELQFPSFAEAHAAIAGRDCLTRVERQIGGGRIPEKISTMFNLKKNITEFDPYTNVEILRAGAALPPRSEYSFAQYSAGLWLRQMCMEMGRDYTEKYIRTHSNGNAARELATYRPFLASTAGEGGAAITREQLFEEYRASVTKQLGRLCAA